MRIRSAASVLVVLLAAAVGWSQAERLGDVAGSIKLDPAAIVEKSGYAEDPREAVQADGELLGGVLAGGSVVADQLASLLPQARKASLMRDTEVLTRLEETALELDRQVGELDGIRVTGALRAPFAAAREAGQACSDAAATVIDEIRARTVFALSRDAVSVCRRGLADAESQLAAATSTTNPPPAARPAEPEEAEAAPSIEETIASICRSRESAGPDEVERCRLNQSLAQAAIASRDSDNEMLDAGIFADIRRSCLELHPADFVDRDRCEQERMTAARLDSE